MSKFCRFFLLKDFIIAFALFFLGKGLSAQIPEDLAEVTIFSDIQKIKPGSSGWLIIEVEVEPGWHMYWKNAGQSGYPTTIEWDSKEVSFEPLRFPSPKAYEFLEMIIYVHEGIFTLMNKFSLNEDFNEGMLQVRGKFSTLICDEENCIPFDTDLLLEIPVGETTQKKPNQSSLIEKAKSKWPIPVPKDAKVSAIVKGDSVALQISHILLKDLNHELFYFFPESEIFGHSLKQQFSLNPKDGALNLSLPINPEMIPPEQLSGVLTHPELQTGWQVLCVVESVNYGKSFIGKGSSTATRYQTVRDDMGMEVLMLLLGMVVIAFAVWLYGKGATPGIASQIRARYQICAVIVGCLGLWFAFPVKEASAENKIEWAVWSPELEAKLKKEGKAVYVDYTARWCASCIANKRVYNFDSIIELFEKKDIVALRADWTDRGNVILDSLKSHNRYGVPLNVYHPAQNEKNSSPSFLENQTSPVILPEFLTKKNVTEAIEKGRVSAEVGEMSFLVILGFATLGGLILNLMPCVFPVIGLKVMSFVKHAGEDPALIKKHGVVFTLGVILSFWLLVGVLLGLRESLSEDLGWGFQLQEPVFVFSLAVFLLIFAMSLSGVFEIGISMTGMGAKLTQSGGLSSSFFSGVLATVVATPCMAPFLGVAVGAALTMEWLPAFTVFTFVGLGLSSPYLILSIFPKWMSKLPKPGAWMDTFKQAMAFPLYGTVAWLLWTLQSLF